MLTELIPDLLQLGYQVEPFGLNTFVIQGTPADLEEGNEKAALEHLMEQYKHFSSDVKFSKREKLIRSLAWQHSVKAGRYLNIKEMRKLVEDLLICAQPNTTPAGTPTYVEFKGSYLQKLFNA
jgi:DNA mismatch repair protein MutL